MNADLEKLKRQLHLRKQEIMHEGLKKLPQDYIDLKRQVDERIAQQTKASTNLFAEAKTPESSSSSLDNKTKI